MRFNLLVIILIALIIFTPLTQIAADDNQIIIINEDEKHLESLTNWNLCNYGIPTGICISSNGILFTTTIYPGWGLSPTQSSLFAFNDNGEMLWSKIGFQLALCDVATDDTNVYITGIRGSGLFISAYNFTGSSLWNVTYAIGGYHCGLRVSVTNDGYIIIRTGSFSETDTDHRFYVVDTHGSVQWYRELPYCSSVAVESNFIYVKCNTTLEKLHTNRTSIWYIESSHFQNEARIIANNGTLYCINDPYAYNRTSLIIERLNTTNGDIEWTTNARITDKQNQVYNWTDINYFVTNSGSLVILLNLPDCGGWHILSITQEGRIAWHYSILDATWASAKHELMNSDMLFVVARNEVNVSMMMYNISLEQTTETSFTNSTESVSEQFNLPLIGFTLVSVVIADTCFVLFLKKKYTK